MRRSIAIIGIGVAVAAAAAVAVIWEPGEGTPDGGPMVTVAVPELDAVAQAGKAAFDRFCAECHGENGAGRQGSGPPLVHKIYRPSHHADGAFLVAVQTGVRQHHWSFGTMPPQPEVSPQEIAEIVRYVRALQRANGIE